MTILEAGRDNEVDITFFWNYPPAKAEDTREHHFTENDRWGDDILFYLGPAFNVARLLEGDQNHLTSGRKRSRAENRAEKEDSRKRR